jgi:hypothetical protein
MNDQDIQAVQRALGAIALIREYYASSTPGYQHAQETLKALRGDGKSFFRVNMADALAATLQNQAIKGVPR